MALAIWGCHFTPGEKLPRGEKACAHLRKLASDSQGGNRNRSRVGSRPRSLRSREKSGWGCLYTRASGPKTVSTSMRKQATPGAVQPEKEGCGRPGKLLVSIRDRSRSQGHAGRGHTSVCRGDQPLASGSPWLRTSHDAKSLMGKYTLTRKSHSTLHLGAVYFL